MSRAIRNAMTVDVEDYFQVQAFASCIDRGEWDEHRPARGKKRRHHSEAHLPLPG